MYYICSVITIGHSTKAILIPTQLNQRSVKPTQHPPPPIQLLYTLEPYHIRTEHLSQISTPSKGNSPLFFNGIKLALSATQARGGLKRIYAWIDAGRLE
jgi:hypothetical protein